MKKKHIINSTSIFAVIIGIILIVYVPKEAKSIPVVGHPTVFVHGYKGTYHSFGNLLNRFENKYNWGNKVLVYRISENGRLHVQNNSKRKKEPIYVQVIFENNRASMNDTTSWLAAVLEHMKSEYNFDTVNLVGHSMGGLVSLKFIEDYSGREGFPRIDKLVTIGSPFDGIYNKEYFTRNWGEALEDLKQGSEALELLRIRKETVPDDLQVLSIASTGDFIAVPESVQALSRIIEEEQLREVLITDRSLGHSEMHENMRIDRMIHKFIMTGTLRMEQ